EVLAQILAGADRVGRKASVHAARAQLAPEGDEPFRGSGARRAGDEQQRGARPAHAESGSRRPARNSGASASQARSGPSSSMQRKWPYGQRARPKNEHGAHSTPANRTACPEKSNIAGSVEPKMASVGTPSARAMCIGPLSLDTNALQREMKPPIAGRSSFPHRSTAPGASFAITSPSPRSDSEPWTATC